MKRPAQCSVLLLALAALGCVSKPTMHLHHAEMRGVQAQIGLPPTVTVTMSVFFAVHNPNSYDVAIRRVRGTTVLADKYAMPVEYIAPGDGLWLPSDRTTLVEVPVSVPVQTGMAVVAEAQLSPQVKYHFVGKADVTGTRTLKIESDDYEVDETGWIPREQIRAALPVQVPFLLQ